MLTAYCWDCPSSPHKQNKVYDSPPLTVNFQASLVVSLVLNFEYDVEVGLVLVHRHWIIGKKAISKIRIYTT